MRMLRTNEYGTAPALMIVAVVAVVAVLLTLVVAVPYMTRAEHYANDPTDPPAEVEAEYEKSDEEPPPPKWMGRFAMTVKVKLSDGEVSGVVIKQGAMVLEEWDGEPWDPASFLTLSPWPWGGDDEGNEKYGVSYELSMSQGRTTYEDEGKFHVYEDYDYQNIGDSNWFFFWEVQEGTWHWELDVTCKGKIDHHIGSFQIVEGGAVN